MKKQIKIFLDGASIVDIKKYKKQKYIKGFTTNPSLMKKIVVLKIADNL